MNIHISNRGQEKFSILKRQYSGLRRRTIEAILNQIVKIHPRPVFALGNQKAGTTAIAALLGAATNKSVTHDFLFWKNPASLERLFFGATPIDEFIHSNKLHFSRDIIKDNSLTFFYNDLVPLFPDAKFFLIIRDPRDNIRSILDRLGIPADMEELGQEHKHRLHTNLIWQLLVEGKWPRVDGETYIERMAHRWNLITDIHTKAPSKITLIRYEDFKKNKKDEIASLATKVGFDLVSDISDLVDMQFQPRGQRDKSWLETFGEANLERINSICGNPMMNYGYTT